MKKPVSRREHLRICADKVKRYTSYIEQKTGVPMGEVGAKSMWRHILDLPVNNVVESSLKDGLAGFIVGAILSPLFAIAAIQIYRRTSAMYDNSPILAMYDNSTIYVNPSKRARLDVLSSPLDLDRIIVHELGHHLWNKLGGEKKLSRDPRLCMMVEGFATYCERTEFADLYPSKQRSDYLSGSPDEVEEGVRRVTHLVKEYGEGVVLKIPRKWRELDGL